MVWGGICEASNEFVDVPDALNGSQWISIPEERTIKGVPVKGKCDEYPVL